MPSIQDQEFKVYTVNVCQDKKYIQLRHLELI